MIWAEEIAERGKKNLGKENYTLVRTTQECTMSLDGALKVLIEEKQEEMARSLMATGGVQGFQDRNSKEA